MFEFSESSTKRLETCHEDLQVIFKEVIKERDCTIIEGFRTVEKQNEYFKEGKSKISGSSGKHCKNPSMAVDVAPFIDGVICWREDKCRDFGRFVVSKAKDLLFEKKTSHSLRWGGDWNRNGNEKDQVFNDLIHFELV